MRLGLVIYGSLDTVSGGYLYDRMLAAHLRQCGDEVDIISVPWRSYGQHLADNFSSTLLRRLRDGRYDVLLQDELNHPSLFILNRRLAGATSRSPRPAPMVSIVHHLRSSESRPAFQNILYRFVERRYLSSVDGFIFNSRATKGAVERLAGNHRPSVVAYPAGDRFGPPLEPDRICKRATRLGPLKLLFVGNIIPRKGLLTLLDALAQISDGWELNVVGSLDFDRNYAEIIRRRAAEMRLVRFSKPDRSNMLTDSELAAELTESHVLVVPSSYEGFGIVYLEGMGFGLPAIATTAGAAGEIITHGRDGFLIDPNESAALAQYIQTLIEDRSLLLNMSLAARERYSQHPTWAQSAGQIRGFLQKIVSH